MKRLRDSIDLEDLEDYDKRDDPDSTLRINAVGSNVVIQHSHGGNASSTVNEPPEAPEPVGVAVLKLLPVWGRTLVVTFLIGASVWTGHSLGWW